VADIVMCWKCNRGIMVQRQDRNTGKFTGASFPVCLNDPQNPRRGVEVMDPRNPPKSCPVAQAWDKDAN
jgi:hypothetical protein